MSWRLTNSKGVVRVLRDVEPEIENIDFLAVSLESYIDEESASISVWKRALKEALDDVNWSGDEEGVEDILEQLKKQCFTYIPPDPLYPGAPVLALLIEDEQWHPAILQSISKEETEPYFVVFCEYQKPQTCTKENVVAQVDVIGDEGDEDLGEGDCMMCERTMRLSFHHLIPKEVNVLSYG